MRWKLIVITSLLSALIGAGASIALTYFFNFPVGSIPHNFSSDRLRIVALVVPLAATIFASIFVYRHTPRRRILQVLLTGLFTATLTLMILAGGYYFI